MTVLHSFWAWLRPATPGPADGFDDPDRPGEDGQFEDWRDEDRAERGEP